MFESVSAETVAEVQAADPLALAAAPAGLTQRQERSALGIAVRPSGPSVEQETAAALAPNLRVALRTMVSRVLAATSVCTWPAPTGRTHTTHTQAIHDDAA